MGHQRSCGDLLGECHRRGRHLIRVCRVGGADTCTGDAWWQCDLNNTRENLVVICPS